MVSLILFIGTEHVERDCRRGEEKKKKKECYQLHFRPGTVLSIKKKHNPEAIY